MTRIILKIIFILSFLCLLSSCGFHLQGERRLPFYLQRMMLTTNDPYGTLARHLKEYLKLSHVTLVASPQEATTILQILSDDATQELLSVSGSQQTRQYNLRVTVVFSLTDSSGRALISPQTLSEVRTITIQSNQILGSSNEASLYYQQMRRTIAYAIINRLASQEITASVQQSLYSFQAKPAS